jgi:hypothetical protein
VAATDVGADDVGVGIDRVVEADGVDPLAVVELDAHCRVYADMLDPQLTAYALDRIESRDAVEQHFRRRSEVDGPSIFHIGIAPQHDRRRETVLGDVPAQREQFIVTDAREQVGGGMDRQNVAPAWHVCSSFWMLRPWPRRATPAPVKHPG